jgi:hypothetical protein
VRRTRGQRRQAARITFTLSAPARVVFVVRGPAPSCGIAGRFSVRGKRGTNRVGFTGRLPRRTLGPGAYRITARTRAGTAARPVVVLIEPTGGKRSFACGRPSGQSDPFVALVGGFTGADGTFLSARPAEAASDEASAGVTRGRTEEQTDTGILPRVKGRIRSIPEILPGVPTTDSSSSPSGVFGALVLLLLAVSALGLLVYVIRFLRRAYPT